jgi:hypothetical protein
MAVGYNGGAVALDAVLVATQQAGRLSAPRQGERRPALSAENILRQKILLAVGGMMIPADVPLRQLSMLLSRTRQRTATPEPAMVAVNKLADLTAYMPCPCPASCKEYPNKLTPMAPTSEIS